MVGAFRLNNGGSGLITLAMLGEIAIYIFILYVYSDKLGENTIPTALYFIGLALLLMTSLRGWYITGHDIQVEYKVFEITKNANFWNMDFYRDAYYAKAIFLSQIAETDKNDKIKSTEDKARAREPLEFIIKNISPTDKQVIDLLKSLE